MNFLRNIRGLLVVGVLLTFGYVFAEQDNDADDITFDQGIAAGELTVVKPWQYLKRAASISNRNAWRDHADASIKPPVVAIVTETASVTPCHARPSRKLATLQPFSITLRLDWRANNPATAPPA